MKALRTGPAHGQPRRPDSALVPAGHVPHFFAGHDGVRACAGGREWVSNPPRTGLRPLPDLKSGRPTGDESLPHRAIAEKIATTRVDAPQIAATRGYAVPIE